MGLWTHRLVPAEQLLTTLSNSRFGFHGGFHDTSLKPIFLKTDCSHATAAFCDFVATLKHMFDDSSSDLTLSPFRSHIHFTVDYG